MKNRWIIITCLLLFVTMTIACNNNTEKPIEDICEAYDLVGYNELVYSDKNNPVFKYYLNYSLNSDGNLVTKEILVLTTYRSKTINEVDTNLQVDTLYSDCIKESYSIPTDSNGAYVSSASSKLLKSGMITHSLITKFFLSRTYEYIDENGELKTETIKLSEELLTLKEEDLSSDILNKVLENAGIFDVFIVSAVKDEEKNSTSFGLSFTISSSVIEKYHLDIQMFVESGEAVYPLIGIYNLSNSTRSSYLERGSVFPSSYDVEYVYVKIKFIDGSGNSYTLLYKDEIQNILR